MALQKLQFRPGINRDTTSYDNEGGWFDCNLVRFRNGVPEKIGGWSKYTSSATDGKVRGLLPFVALNGSEYLAIGTSKKYYIYGSGVLNNVTPVRKTSSLTNPLAATNGSATVTVTDAGHGAEVGDYVTLAVGTNMSGSALTTTVLSKEYEIQSVPSDNTYTITASVNADADDSGGGGSVTATYQINTGLDNQIAGTGWGASPWNGRLAGALTTTINEGGTFSASDTTLTVASGTGIVTNDVIRIDNELLLVTGVSTNDLTVVRSYAGAGTSSNVQTAGTGLATTHANGATVILIKGNASTDVDFIAWGAEYTLSEIRLGLRLIHHDLFTEDIIFNIRDGAVYYWDTSANQATFSPAIELKDLSGTDGFAPRVAKKVIVSDVDRHVIAFGADSIDDLGVQDPLMIRFSSQNDPTQWFPRTTNTADFRRLSGGTEIVTAVQTRQETLIFTDASLHSMQFVGPPFIFSINQISGQTTIMGPNAAVAVDGVVFWMGKENFYMYTGQVQKMPCTVRSKVFDDFNLGQSAKVEAGVNSAYNEVWWFYTSEAASNNDKYVVYNYLEQVWYFGNMPRTAWLDRGIYDYPLAASTDGFIYEHERILNDGSTSPETGLNSFIESSPMDIGDGDSFTLVRKLVPDITFRGSTTTDSIVNVTLKAQNYPGGDNLEEVSSSVQASQVSPVDRFTEKVDIRLRGRAFTFRYESTDVGVNWRAGAPRVDIRTDGRR